MRASLTTAVHSPRRLHSISMGAKAIEKAALSSPVEISAARGKSSTPAISPRNRRLPGHRTYRSASTVRVCAKTLKRFINALEGDAMLLL